MVIGCVSVLVGVRLLLEATKTKACAKKLALFVVAFSTLCHTSNVEVLDVREDVQRASHYCEKENL